MELAEIGYFSKTHGIKGQLLLKPSQELDTAALKAVFVDMHGGKAPMFVSSLAVTPHGILVLLEEIPTVEQARALLNKKVYAAAAIIIEAEDEDDLIGYEVLDSAFGSLGKVVSVSDNGAQQLLVLNFKNKEVMLPLVDEFVEEIDDKKLIIHYKAPEGLIDLFLEEE